MASSFRGQAGASVGQRRSYRWRGSVCLLALMTGFLPGATLAARVPKEAEIAAYLADKPAQTQPMFRNVLMEGERNRVLNLDRAGLAALELGDDATAAKAFDEATAQILAVYAHNPAAEKARSKFVKEAVKPFKGEPYERAMAFLYRGLIYLHDGDYENARAAFRRGLMQDAFAEEDQNRSDFAVLLYLDAWASHLNGDKDLRDETLVQLKKLRPSFGGFGEKDDTLVWLETGQGPRKLGDGASHSFFVYRRGKPILENQAQVMLGAAALQAYPMEDIFYQASTRGGREIDKILEGKAQFKAVTGGVGSFLADTTVALQDSSALSGGGQFGDAVAAVGVLSGVFLIVSSSAKPQADVRTWSSLPDTIHVLTLASGGKPQDLQARFLKAGLPVADKPIRCEMDENHKQLCLVRAH